MPSCSHTASSRPVADPRPVRRARRAPPRARARVPGAGDGQRSAWRPSIAATGPSAGCPWFSSVVARRAGVVAVALAVEVPEQVVHEVAGGRRPCPASLSGRREQVAVEVEARTPLPVVERARRHRGDVRQQPLAAHASLIAAPCSRRCTRQRAHSQPARGASRSACVADDRDARLEPRRAARPRSRRRRRRPPAAQPPSRSARTMRSGPGHRPAGAAQQREARRRRVEDLLGGAVAEREQPELAAAAGVLEREPGRPDEPDPGARARSSRTRRCPRRRRPSPGRRTARRTSAPRARRCGAPRRAGRRSAGKCSARGAAEGRRGRAGRRPRPGSGSGTAGRPGGWRAGRRGRGRAAGDRSARPGRAGARSPGAGRRPSGGDGSGDVGHLDGPPLGCPASSDRDAPELLARRSGSGSDRRPSDGRALATGSSGGAGRAEILPVAPYDPPVTSDAPRVAAARRGRSAVRAVAAGSSSAVVVVVVVWTAVADVPDGAGPAPRAVGPRPAPVGADASSTRPS